MSNEIRFQADSGSTLYALIRAAGGTVWKPSTAEFVAWVDGNIGDYDIPLTDRSGGLYEADFPALAAGLYAVQVRKQAGASPAADDEIVSDGLMPWSGSAVVSLGALATAVDTRAAPGDKMDLVDAPNATAVTALQSGLSTLTAQQVWEYAVRTLSAFGFTVPATVADKTGYSLTSAYDAAKTAAAPGSQMALTADQLAAIRSGLALDATVAKEATTAKDATVAKASALATLQALAEADWSVDTTDPAQFKLIVKNRSTGATLLTKKLLDIAGNPITSAATPVAGQEDA